MDKNAYVERMVRRAADNPEYRDSLMEVTKKMASSKSETLIPCYDLGRVKIHLHEAQNINTYVYKFGAVCKGAADVWVHAAEVYVTPDDCCMCLTFGMVIDCDIKDKQGVFTKMMALFVKGLDMCCDYKCEIKSVEVFQGEDMKLITLKCK